MLGDGVEVELLHRESVHRGAVGHEHIPSVTASNLSELNVKDLAIDNVARSVGEARGDIGHWGNRGPGGPEGTVVMFLY